MDRSGRFWIGMAVFQVVFGLTVFVLTREYYIRDSENVSSGPVTTGEFPVGSTNRVTKTGPGASGRSTPGQPAAGDPALISRQADESFDSQQFDRAAELYARLLELEPKNVNAYNNLGLTLHYLGRSAEALRKLNEGVALDPTYQRIWLTLGFVNSQLGDIQQARKALTTAAEMDPDNEVGQSASKMLGDLPAETLAPLDSH